MWSSIAVMLVPDCSQPDFNHLTIVSSFGSTCMWRLEKDKSANVNRDLKKVGGVFLSSNYHTSKVSTTRNQTETPLPTKDDVSQRD
jgi:hypothetical protein